MRERTKSWRCFAASYSAFSDRSPCAAAVGQLLRELDGELVLQVGQLLLEPGEDGELHDVARIQPAARRAPGARSRSRPCRRGGPRIVHAMPSSRRPSAAASRRRAPRGSRPRAPPRSSSAGTYSSRMRALGDGSATTRSSRPALTRELLCLFALCGSRGARPAPGRPRPTRCTRFSTFRFLAAATTPRSTSTRCASRAFIAAVRSWASCSSVTATGRAA